MPGLHRLQEYAKQDEGDAEVEGEINLATLAENEESKDNSVAWLKIICQIDGKSGEALQGLDLKQIYTNGTEERMT